MSKSELRQDWRAALQEFLIASGTQGRSKSEISAKFTNVTTGEALEHELDALHVQDKVQKFEVPPENKKGHAKVVWRATTKILD